MQISLVIFGSQTAYPIFDEIETALAVLDRRCPNINIFGAALDQRLTVISGRARGADSCGEAWARRYSVPVVPMPADWGRYGKAGPIRNRAMAELATHGIGFWHRESHGTANMATHMAILGKPCAVLEWTPKNQGDQVDDKQSKLAL